MFGHKIHFRVLQYPGWCRNESSIKDKSHSSLSQILTHHYLNIIKSYLNNCYSKYLLSTGNHNGLFAMSF